MLGNTAKDLINSEILKGIFTLELFLQFDQEEKTAQNRYQLLLNNSFRYCKLKKIIHNSNLNELNN